MAAPVLQFKRGLLANLPGLRVGEPGFTTDSYDLYVGIDSTTTNNKFFGSHRYWSKETTSRGSGVNLVEGTTNGTSYITLKAPDSLAGITTYTFPATATADYYLKTAADGTLSWAAIAQNSFSGIVTFTDTTDNTLGNADTGSVQIDGGLGINKNLTVGQNLSVQGYAEFVGVATFKGGTINLGDSTGDDINVGGEFISGLFPNTTATYDLGDSSRQWRNGNFSGIVTATTFSGTATTATRAQTIDIASAPSGVYYPTLSNVSGSGTTSLYTDTGLYYVAQSDTLFISGNVSIGGTSGVLFVTNLFVNDKDIVVGYTTDASNNDISKDSTSTHGGISVASTTGSPLFNMPQVAGVNSLPFTYKQFMWIAQNTSGYSGMGTDAWVSNYAVAIGTVTVANNSRFTVGAGFTVYDTYLDANAFDIRVRNINAVGVTTLTNAGGTNLNFTGVGTVTTLNTTNLVPTRINSSGVSTLTTLNSTVATLTNAGGTNLNFTGVGTVTTLNSTVATLTNAGGTNLNFTGVSTLTTLNSTVATLTNAGGTNLNFTGVSTLTTLNATNSRPTNLNVSGIATITNATGTNLNFTGISTLTSISVTNLTSTNLNVSGITTLTTLNATNARPTNLNVSGITTLTGAVSTGSDLTVGGNLYVNGSTTQVNTAALTVEDRTIELGVVDGSAPSSTTTWDLGVLFNYYDGSAKKSALVWEQGDARFKLGSVISADADGSGTSNPQITFTTYAPLEIGGLWVNDCAGQSQVIACSGSTRTLENITIDAGTF